MAGGWLPRRLAASLLILGLACDGSAVSDPVSTRCREAAAQCQLPEGPLGVCERRPCGVGEDGPCFACVPQH